MGSTVETVVNTPLLVFTRSPTCACAIPAMPSIGETMRVNPRLMPGRFDSGFADLNLSLRRSNGCFCGQRLVFVGKVRLICVIEVLFADRIDRCQRSVLVYIELTLHLVRMGCGELCLILSQLRLCLSQLRLCLVKRRLEWSRINLKEEFSLPDVGPLLIFPSEQIAGDLRFYVCIHLPGESPDPFSINGNVPLLDGCDLYNGWWRRLHRGLGPRACQDNEQNDREKGA